MTSYDRLCRLGIDPSLTGDALRDALIRNRQEILDRIERQRARAAAERSAEAVGLPVTLLDDKPALTAAIDRMRAELDALTGWIEQEQARISALPTAGEWVRNLLASGFVPVSVTVVRPDENPPAPNQVRVPGAPP